MGTPDGTCDIDTLLPTVDEFCDNDNVLARAPIDSDTKDSSTIMELPNIETSPDVVTDTNDEKVVFVETTTTDPSLPSEKGLTADTTINGPDTTASAPPSPPTPLPSDATTSSAFVADITDSPVASTDHEDVSEQFDVEVGYFSYRIFREYIDDASDCVGVYVPFYFSNHLLCR